jgi:curved DNA-binding protein CbpA
VANSKSKSKNKKKQNEKELNEAIFREIAEAHEVLSSPANREEYDRKRKILLADSSRSERSRSSFSANQYRRERDGVPFENVHTKFDSTPRTGFEEFFANIYKQFMSSSGNSTLQSTLKTHRILYLFPFR